jgi:hypothetical protein
MKMNHYVALTALFLCGCTATPTTAQNKHAAMYDRKEVIELGTAIVDAEIRAETANRPPSAGYKTWAERWNSTIKALRAKKRAGADCMIQYIIDERRRKGLPELPRI